jgi:hypothetical protein
LRQLAHDLAIEALDKREINILPVFISLNRINFEGGVSSLEAGMEEWGWLLDALPFPYRYLFLFDGLDEIGLSPTSKPEEFLRELINLAPRGARFAISCRSHTFQQRRQRLLESALSCEVPISDDPTDWAISATLDRPIVCSLCNVNDKDADNYISSGSAAAVWNSIRYKESYYALSRQPVMLRLLEKALPRLMTSEHALTASELYRVAMETWLRRDAHCRNLNQPPEYWFEILRVLSGLMFPLASVTLKTAEKHFSKKGNPQELIDALVNADILELDVQEILRFSHQSLFEYFFAILLYSQLEKYNAQFLAVTNLVYSYAVNRFLVPMLQDRHEKGDSTSLKLISMVKARTEVRTNGAIMSRPVSKSEFLLFMNESGWRRNIGFGLWRVLGAADGTNPAVGIDLNHQGLGYLASVRGLLQTRTDLPVVDISWYDAWQFCRWVGGRLPSADDLEKCEAVHGETIEREWTGTWLDESKSLILTLSTDRKEHCGLNPDIRLDTLGFRVLFPHA